MSTRTVEVRLKANIADFRAGMAAAGKSVDDVQRRLHDGDAKTKANLQQVSRGMLLVGGAAVAGAAVAVTAFAKFDKTMSGVKAVSNATAADMDKLRAAALEAGKATVFSASESAQAEAELAKAGVSTADILGGALRGSLDLAAAGQLELADAATIAAQAMNIFKLEGKDVTHVADVLAAGANKSAADVKQLGDALRQGGLVAAQSGASLEETVGTLSAFADSALISSDAGTSLKTMLQRLVPQSDKAKGAMEDIGLKAFDAQGKFVGLETIAGQLQMGLGKLSDEQRQTALTTIFGSDAVRAASVLYEQGASGIRDYTQAVDDQGAASRMAATQLDNLAGDVEQLKGSFETALIGAGSGANGTLRGATQALTGLVNRFNDLPPAVQGTTTAIAGVGGSVIAAAGAFGLIAPKITETRKGLRDLGTAGQFADRSLGRLGKAAAIGGAIVIAAAAVDALGDAIREKLGDAPPNIDRLTNSLIRFNQTGKLTGEGARIAGEGMGDLAYQTKILTDGGALGHMRNFDSQLRFVTLGMADNVSEFAHAEEAYAGYDQTLAGLVQSGNTQAASDLFNDIATAATAGGKSVDDVKGLLPGYEDALAGANTQAALAADSTADFGSAAGQVSPALSEATDAIDDYKLALDNLNGVNITAARAQLSLNDAYKAAHKAADDSVKVTDKETGALLDLADQANSTAGAILDQTGSQNKANDSLRTARKRFIDTAIEMGHTRKEARDLADTWLQIPTKRQTKYTTNGVDTAQTVLAKLRDTILAIPTHRSVSVTVGTVNKLGANDDFTRASGGPVWPGSTFLVGENGPELFTPSARGSIIPAGPTAAVMAGASMTPAGGYSGAGSSTSSTSPTYGGDTYKVYEAVSARQTAGEIILQQRRARFERAGAW